MGWYKQPFRRRFEIIISEPIYYQEGKDRKDKKIDDIFTLWEVARKGDQLVGISEQYQSGRHLLGYQ